MSESNRALMNDVACILIESAGWEEVALSQCETGDHIFSLEDGCSGVAYNSFGCTWYLSDPGETRVLPGSSPVLRRPVRNAGNGVQSAWHRRE